MSGEGGEVSEFVCVVKPADVNNEGVNQGTALDLENPAHGFRLEGVSCQAVNSFRRDGDESALTQVFRSLEHDVGVFA